MTSGLRSAPVYDPALRLLHWSNALLVLALLATGLVAQLLQFGALASDLRGWHGIVGNAFVVGLLGRLLWGWIGPRHARWTSMWQPQAWAEALRKRQIFIEPSRFGHHPVASLAYLAVYTLMLVLVVSGLILLAIKQGHGPLSPWLEGQIAWKHWTLWAHQLAAYGLLAFVVAHLSALVLHHRIHRLPVAQSMISGIQSLPEKPA
jgi:Ni,Fe-hydrogenase I cytochrome b subunit